DEQRKTGNQHRRTGPEPSADSGHASLPPHGPQGVGTRPSDPIRSVAADARLLSRTESTSVTPTATFVAGSYPLSGNAGWVPVRRTRTFVVLLGAIASVVLAMPAAASAGSANVAALQVAMSGLGLYPHPVDGITGSWTQQAVRTFQSQHGLAADGI